MKKRQKQRLRLTLSRDLVASLALTPAEALHLADLLSHLQAALFDYHACATEFATDRDLNGPEPYL
jgi:hypothetical protein